MGSFSWTKADYYNTREANVREGKSFKFLIPAEFGGGFIKDKYRDYGDLGKIGSETILHDMYELLAIWNADMPYKDGEVRDYLKGNISPMKRYDEDTYTNRIVGIEIGCYVDQIEKLKYPLKLVSASYKGTYEECKGKSYGDPNQGWGALDWGEWERVIEAEKHWREGKNNR